MKFLIFFSLLLIYSLSWAEWEITNRAEDGKTTYYHDKSSIRRKGAIAKMWTMKDFSVVKTNSKGKKYKSSESLYVFDCRSEKMETVSFIQYSDAMGGGTVVLDRTLEESEWEWNSIPSESTEALFWKTACNRWLSRLQRKN